MSSNLHIDFQLGGQSYHVNFKLEEDSSSLETILIGGRSYSLEGSEAAIGIVKKYLAELPQDSIENLQQTGKELKVKLWQAGAKEIEISLTEKTQIVSSRILGCDSLDLPKIVNSVCTLLEAHYVYPEVAARCSDYIQDQFTKGAYDSISDPDVLAEAITADLRLISEDKHIAFKTISSTNGSESPKKMTEPYALPELTQVYSYTSKLYSSSPPEITSGFLADHPEVGYIDLHVFNDCWEEDVLKKIAKAEKHIDRLKEQRDHVKKSASGREKRNSLNAQIAVHEKRLQELKQIRRTDLSGSDILQDIHSRKKAFVKAVQNIKTAKSIVIDLRNNHGGDPSAVQFFCSLFMDEDFPLSQFEIRRGDTFETEAFSTLSYRELPLDVRLLETPVSILISPDTFSAAEEFSNNMKVLGRATLIGEPSGGGANPGRFHLVEPSFEMFIPWGRSIDAFGSGNWEGVGVIPDHVVPATEALDQALHLTGDL